MSTPEEVSFPMVSPSEIIMEICQSCGPDEGSEELEWAESETLELQITSWCSWFTDNHPPGSQPRKIANAKQWDVDFRIFFIVFPTSGARLLRLVEACYGIDKALCGASTLASQEAKKWREMDQFEYLMSEDLISRWKIDLCQFQENIEQENSGELATSIRVHDFEVAASALSYTLQGTFWDDAFGSVEEDGWFASFKLQKSIEARESLISISLPALKKSFNAAKKGEHRNSTKSTIPDPAKAASSTGFQDQALLNEGVRKRIPRNTTPNNAAAVNDVEGSEDRSGSSPSSSSISDISSETSPPLTNTETRWTISSCVEVLRHKVGEFRASSERHLVPRRVVEFFIHKSTVFVLTLCFVAASGAFGMGSVFLNQTKDSSRGQLLNGDFCASSSQAILSVLTTYLTALPPLRSRTLHLRYKSLFWGWTLISAVAAILSPILYHSQPTVSVVFGYVANFAQAANTLLLVECVEEAVQAGDIGGH